MMRWLLVLLGVTALTSVAGVASAATCDPSQSTWLFCEDFEQGGLGWSSWFDQSPFVECLGCSDGTNDPDRILLDGDAANAHDGSWSLYMPAGAAAQYQGATLNYRSCSGAKQGGCPLQGYEQLYFRAWVKLAPDHRKVHHFMSIGGSRPDAYWETYGNAGCRPNGRSHAGTTVDFNESHELFFYTYFPEMHCDDLNAGGGYCAGMQPDLCNGCADKDMPCSNGPECCWGNTFTSDPPPVLPLDQWVCLEMMMKLNTPGNADGEMSFWVNEQLGHHQGAMRWRDVAELQLNRISAQHYIDVGDADQSNRIWWDDIVASTERIGCGTAPPPTDGGSVPEPSVDHDASGGEDASAGKDAHGADAVSDRSTGDGPGAAGADAQPSDGATDPDDGGCGCRQTNTGSPWGALSGIVLGLLVAVRRYTARP